MMLKYFQDPGVIFSGKGDEYLIQYSYQPCLCLLTVILNTPISCTLRISDVDWQPFFQMDPEETWCSAKDVKSGGKLDLCGCNRDDFRN